jgi:hypothetical protein
MLSMPPARYPLSFPLKCTRHIASRIYIQLEFVLTQRHLIVCLYPVQVLLVLNRNEVYTHCLLFADRRGVLCSTSISGELLIVSHL